MPALAFAQAQTPPEPPLRVRAEFRERMEVFDGSGFTASRDDLYWLTRFRLNAIAAPSKRLSFQFQAQDARVAHKTVGATGPPFRAPLDLRMAFAEVGAADTPISVRVGRQELAYGEQRLIGPSNWSNTARTFDAARITVDAFGASIVRVFDKAAGRSGNGNRFAGTYATTAKLIPQTTVDQYVFVRRDTNLRTDLTVNYAFLAER